MESEIKTVRGSASAITFFAIAGGVLLLVSMLLYLQYGYHHAITILWLLSLILVGIYFSKKDTSAWRHLFFIRHDFVIVALLTLIIGATYFSVSPMYPAQMVGDEVSITLKSSVLSESEVDLFKPSDYFNLPAPFFTLSGHLARLLGPIDVLHVRLVHTFFTIIVCLVGFFFFRLVFDRFKAGIATILFAGGHSLFAIGHMAMLTNSAVLVCLISMVSLYIGLWRQSLLWSFIGGASAGIGWFVYSPAKAIIVVWLAALALLVVIFKCKLSEKIALTRIVFATLIGFAMAFTPFILGAIITPQEVDTTWSYFQQQFLFTRIGRQWNNNDSSVFGIVKDNALDALTVFNRPIQDKGYIYNYYGKHGFVDPMTGMLLWVGVLSVLLTLRRRDIKTVLVLLHFLLFLGMFMFFVNRSPNYTRFIVMLPFVIPLVVIGSHTLAKRISWPVVRYIKWHRLQKNTLEKILLVVIAVAIIYLNVGIFSDYLRKGENDKLPIEDAIRYLHVQSVNEPEPIYLFNKTTASHNREVWDAHDWQRVWLNLFIVFNGPVKDFTLKEYVSYRYGRKMILFDSHREPIAHTIYHITTRARSAPHYFYFVSGYEGNRPEEFKSDYDWEIWLNLFTVFRQSFEILTEEHFLAGGHSFPATFFITADMWKEIRDQVSADDKTITVNYLSSRKNLLVVEIIPFEMMNGQRGIPRTGILESL